MTREDRGREGCCRNEVKKKKKERKTWIRKGRKVEGTKKMGTKKKEGRRRKEEAGRTENDEEG